MFSQKITSIHSIVHQVAMLTFLLTFNSNVQAVATNSHPLYQHEETRQLVTLVENATELYSS